jgi:hypothetical protein
MDEQPSQPAQDAKNPPSVGHESTSDPPPASTHVQPASDDADVVGDNGSVTRAPVTRHNKAIPGRNGGFLRPIQPGQVLNPRGRPAAGAVYIEWMNALADRGPAELEKIIADPKSPAAKIMAARDTLEAVTGAVKYHVTEKGTAVPTGELVQPGKARDRILDRTVGKPVQSVVVQRVPDREPAEIMEEIRALLRDPELARLVWEDRALAADAEAMGLLAAGEENI